MATHDSLITPFSGQDASADACSMAGGHRKQCQEGLCAGRVALRGVAQTEGEDIMACATGTGAGLWWRYNGDGMRTAEDCSSFGDDEAGACARGAGTAAIRESLYVTGSTNDAKAMCEAMGTLMDACLMGVAEGASTE